MWLDGPSRFCGRSSAEPYASPSFTCFPDGDPGCEFEHARRLPVTRGTGRAFDGLLQAQIVSEVLVVPTDTLHAPVRVIVMLGRSPIVLEELSGVRKRPRIRSMPD